MPLGVRPFAIGYRREEVLQQAQRPVHVIVQYAAVHLGHHGIGEPFPFYIIRQQAPQQPDADFPVGQVKRVEFRFLVVILDSHVTALVEQRGNAFDAFRGSIEVRGHGLHSPPIREGSTPNFRNISIR